MERGQIRIDLWPPRASRTLWPGRIVEEAAPCRRNPSLPGNSLLSAGLHPRVRSSPSYRAAFAPPVSSVRTFLLPCPALAPPHPAPKQSVMIPNLRVPQGQRHPERLLNGFSSRLQDESPASTTLPSSEAALVADLLRPGSLRVQPEQLTQSDSHQLDFSLVGSSPVVLGLSLRRSAAPLRFFCFPSPALAPAAPDSQILSHDSKSPCSAGKATHGAAAERSSLVRKVSPWSPLRRLPRPSALQYRTPCLPRNPAHRLSSQGRRVVSPA